MAKEMAKRTTKGAVVAKEAPAARGSMAMGSHKADPTANHKRGMGAGADFKRQDHKC
jgi:hypothetical protein